MATWESIIALPSDPTLSSCASTCKIYLVLVLVGEQPPDNEMKDEDLEIKSIGEGKQKEENIYNDSSI